MQTITTTEALAAFCAEAAGEPYVTVDTEFLRERTYYSKLCLVQLALPVTPADNANDRAVLVDPLVDGIDLAPLFDLMRNPAVTKVFHAARQDVEIFWIDGGVIPQPLFDTQIASMVCGFGEQAGYETLVRKIARANLDKTSRFTDWSHRPLTDAQKRYALADVTHLRVIYEHLAAELERNGRAHWLAEEMEVLSSPETYITRPEDAWQRIKTRGQSGKFMAAVKELARFREEMAQSRNIPRSRVFKDDAILEMASTRPDSHEALGRSRLLLREARRGEIADGILAAVRAAQAMPPEDWPVPLNGQNAQMQVNPALADLLRVLLKARSEESGVAQKLIANAADLDAIAAGQRDLSTLRGWRAELFGNDALRLCRGELALTAKGAQVRTIELPV
ncbi:ribonuclease D [Pararhodobacter sp. SW119]|uniref:ribonuclease D n=1 Tax=Pararhodobacter sp. SW119 TaxID=2780075 RepID=UPI001ADFD484|nr:ribonuclease D [Pararhodobacter sp. SW119]